MYLPKKDAPVPLGGSAELVSDDRIAQLVGQVYAAGPAAEQTRLLEHLMRPLGVLSLVAVANGIFAKFRFRSGWQHLQLRLEDAQSVRSSDVVALVHHVQQVRVEAVDGLVKILIASPVMAGSAAAALLVTVLVQRARMRRGNNPADAADTGDAPYGNDPLAA